MSKKHSPIGASSMPRWGLCAGSNNLIKRLGLKSTSSKYAEEGQQAHSLAELMLKDTDYNRELYADKYGSDMADACHKYRDFVTTNFDPTTEVVEIEKKINMEWLHPGMFGTVDASIAREYGTLKVYDYKHGKGVLVNVKDNWQLLYYAVGLAHGGDYSHVEMAIIQPRASGYTEPEVWRLRIEELNLWRDTVLLPKVKATLDPNAPLTPGAKQCRFCPANKQMKCPAIKDKALMHAQEVFGTVEFRDPGKTVLPKAEELSNHQIKNLYELQKCVSLYAAEVTSYIQSQLEAGIDFPGFKLVKKKGGKRIWSDSAKALKIIAQYKMDLDKVYTRPVMKTPPQMEKAFNKTDFSRLSSCISKTDPGVTIARIEDKRPAVCRQTLLGEVIAE